MSEKAPEEQLAEPEDRELGEAAEKAVASSPRVGSEAFTAALKRFADDPEAARQMALAEEGMSRYREQLAKLAELPDEAIDTDDIPEAPAENWHRRKRGAAEC